MTIQSSHTEIAKTWINGQYRIAEKHFDGNWYVKDDSGKLIKVDPDDLFGVNSSKSLTETPEHFSKYYHDLYEKAANNIAALKEEGSILRKALKSAKETYHSFMANLGAKSIHDITNESERARAKQYLCDISSGNSALRRNSSDIISEAHFAFDCALKEGDWNNQLAIAEHVQQSAWNA